MSRLERIVAAWGGILIDGGRKALVRGPGHSASDRSVSLMETEDGRIMVHGFSPKHDWRTLRDALAADGLLDGADNYVGTRAPSVRVAVQPATEDRVSRARRIWEESRPLGGSAAELYLRKRAISRALPDAHALRAHPHATGLDDRARRPALIAAIRDGDGELCGVQITLLTRYGERKAHVSTPRRVIGKAAGGAVQLDPARATLLIAEGVETALSASEALGLSAWAALSAVALARFKPPAIVRRLVIAADDDPAGAAAAADLARVLEPTLDVEIRCPGDGFGDWNERAIALGRVNRSRGS